jgi:hypothetical protein
MPSSTDPISMSNCILCPCSGVSREVDSCDSESVGIELMRSAAEPAGVADPAVQTARELLDAVARRDQTAVRRLLADPNDVLPYLESGDARSGHSQTTRFVRPRGDGELAVEFAVYSETGCQVPWLARMARRQDGWRVSGLERLAGRQ